MPRTTTRLGFKVICLVLTALATVLALLVFQTYQAEMKSLSLQIDRRGNALATSASIMSIEAFLTYDYPVLETYAETLTREDNGIAFVIFTRADGQVLVEQPSDAGLSSRDDQSLRAYSARIQLESGATEILGEVVLGVSVEEMQRAAHKRLRKTILQSFLAFVFVALGLAMLLHQLVSRPLTYLTGRARALGDGDLDTPINLPADDDLGHLGRAFDHMRRQLKASRSELLTKNEKLRQTLDSLDEALHEAKRLSRTKSEFLANMSHEIRTPMNGVMGMAELMLQGELSQHQRRRAETIQQSASALLTILNDILDYSKIEAGKLLLDPIAFDLREVAEKVMQLASTNAQAKGLELILRYVPGTPRWLLGDADRIRQILTNLVGNAIKFTEQGHVLITIGHFGCMRNVIQIHMLVSDTGIGIPDDQARKIFEEFAQADSSTTRRFGGTGLGLSICAKLTSLMAGEIWCESEPERGSNFVVTIPLPIAEKPSEVIRADLGDLAGRRVLVVDDHPVNRQMLKEMLENWSLQPTLAANGEEATALVDRARAEGTPYHLALIDACMPRIDGYALTKRLLNDADPYVDQVLILTSSDRDETIARSRKAGAAAVLIKPIRQNELLHAILTALGTVAAPPADATPDETPRASRSLRVLLAEDNQVNQLVAIGLLHKLGHTVIVANNGVEAVAAVQKDIFDVVLMDVQMPKMNGLEATAEIRRSERARGTHIPIIALTAHAMNDDRQRCLEAGMDEYLTKPIAGKQLSAILNNLCVLETTDSASHPVLV